MAQRTCSFDECDSPVVARGWCRHHYNKWHEAEKRRAEPLASKPCLGCGAMIDRTSKAGAIRDYCTPDCRPRCSIAGCEKPTHSKGMCSAHATRAARYGDPLAPKTRRANGPRATSGNRRRVIPAECSVDGCDRPSRRRGWCASHYSQWYRTGEVKPFAYTWADAGNPCIICGGPTGAIRRRDVCSAVCQRIKWQYGGPPPNPTCARCGVEIDLLTEGKGRRKRLDTKLCRRCKVQNRTEATPGELALRDGPYCQLCGCDVDLLAVFPDPMRPSVDHIIPRAWGGSDAADNNQLTHLLCNQIKSDRYLGLSRRSPMP